MVSKLTHVYLAPKPADQADKWSLCRIVCRGRGPGPHNLLIEFADGRRTVTCRAKKKDGSNYSVRPAKDKDRQIGLFEV